MTLTRHHLKASVKRLFQRGFFSFFRLLGRLGRRCAAVDQPAKELADQDGADSQRCGGSSHATAARYDHAERVEELRAAVEKARQESSKKPPGRIRTASRHCSILSG